MSRGRAFSRHQVLRAKARVRVKFALQDRPEASSSPVEVGIHAGVRGHCSCEMCRNPRRSSLYKGDAVRSMQERRAEDAERHEG